MTRLARAAAATIAVAAPLPALGQALIDQCHATTCQARLTASEVLREAQQLVVANRYADAAPFIAALARAPGLRFEYRFLAGYAAGQQGDHATAARMYKAILTDDPRQTRVRLELARTMLAMGKPQSAERQFRIAEQDKELPPEIARTIRRVRDVIRSKRAWTLNVDLGFAPDTNINNATASDTVTIMYGTQPIPVSLNADAKAKSGVGVTGSIEAGLRLPVAKHVAAIVDATALGNEYKGRYYDDYAYELAGGAEVQATRKLRARVQAVAAQRVFGQRIASRQYGLKGGVEQVLTPLSRLGLQLDVRHTDARFDHNYDGTQAALYATYERAVSKTFIVSGGIFGRRDWLRADAYSNVELGGIAGIGGELPKGFNVALSGTASRAWYDAPIPLFSVEPRHDWRFNARATVGNRGLRWQGFSPTVSVSYGRVDSTLDYYENSRFRVRFAVARYF